MKLYFFILALLTACTQPPVRPPMSDIVLVPQKDKVNVPQQLLVKCPLLNPLEVRDYSKKELVDLAKSYVNIYDMCRTKDSILVDAVEKAFNTVPIPNAVNKVQ